MLNSILIGLDGSPSSETAVELGILWAKRFDALLAGLGIVDAATIRSPAAGPIEGGYYSVKVYEELVEEALHTTERFLEQFAARCTAAKVPFELLEDTGMPYQEILRESQRYDLVLFGHETHFRFGIEGRPDKTLWNVLKREPRPVAIAPRELKPGATVLVAYNGSPPAERALQAFQSSGLDLGEEVCVFCAHSEREEAAQRAETGAEFLRSHQIDATAYALGPVDSVSQSILAEVGRRKARLLVMGAYGHSTVRELLLGSLTTAVLKESPVPVFLSH